MYSFTLINPLTRGAFCQKMQFLDILVVLRLNLGQISFNLVKIALATQQLALLATKIVFYNILARACAEIKILSFWTSRWPTCTPLGFSIFGFFFSVSFFSFSFLFVTVIDLLLGLLVVEKLLRQCHRGSQF